MDELVPGDAGLVEEGGEGGVVGADDDDFGEGVTTGGVFDVVDVLVSR
jgi:hypothetical protein